MGRNHGPAGPGPGDRPGPGSFNYLAGYEIDTLLARYAVQTAIDRAASQAFDLLGGMAFIQSPAVAYLLAAVRGPSLHPPPRLATGKRLDGYLAGSPSVLD